MRAAATAAITLLVLLCSGCGNAHHYADPSCAAVLGQVSTVPPYNGRQLAREIDELAAVTPASATLRTLTNRVLSELENGDYEQYVADVVHIQHYCAG